MAHTEEDTPPYPSSHFADQEPESRQKELFTETGHSWDASPPMRVTRHWARPCARCRRNKEHKVKQHHGAHLSNQMT